MRSDLNRGETVVGPMGMVTRVNMTRPTRKYTQQFVKSRAEAVAVGLVAPVRASGVAASCYSDWSWDQVILDFVGLSLPQVDMRHG